MSSTSIDLLLSRLDGVKPNGRGWRAYCPCCGGRGSKVSVAAGDDGRALLHCFGGCDAATVVEAVGLSLGALFPERPADDTPESRRRMSRVAREAQWGAALEMLDTELCVIHFAAREVKAGRSLSNEDAARLELATTRVCDARTVLREQKPWRPQRNLR